MFENKTTLSYRVDYLSFGAGVQTTALLCLYKEGKLSFKKAVFADTGAETEKTYKHLENLKKLFPNLIETTKKGHIIEDTLKEKYVTAPVFTDDNRKGRRVCTARYKIDPVSNKIRELEGLKRKHLKEDAFSLALGFSTDEYWRAKPNRTRWLKNVFPLLDLKLSRSNCLDILKKHNIEPIRSACYFCPLQSNSEWKRLKNTQPKEFKKAVKFDKQIRDIKKPFQNFIHRNRQPLNKVVFKETDQQINLFSLNDCQSGYGGP